MTQSFLRRHPSRSYHHVSEVNINTAGLYQIPAKTINVRSQINTRKTIGIVFAAVAVICISLAMTLPFLLNRNTSKSSTIVTTLNLVVAVGSSVTTVTSTTATVTGTTTTATDSITSTTTDTSTTIVITTTTDSTTSTTATTTESTTSTTTRTTTTTTDTTVSTTTTTDTTVTTTTTSATETTTSTTSVTPTTTTQNPYACSNMTVLNGFDLSGGDLTFQYTANYTLCCAFCLSNSSCIAYTWVKGTGSSPCYLKKSKPTASANSGLVSAYF